MTLQSNFERVGVFMRMFWAGLLFSAFWGHIGSRFIICMSWCDSCCLFRVLIQSPGFLWWAGLDRTKKEKSIHIYVSFMLPLQRSVWKLLLLWRKSLNFCVFQQSESTLFLRADATLQHFCSGQIESSLVRIQFESNPQVLHKEQASWWRPRRYNWMFSFEKPNVFP